VNIRENEHRENSKKKRIDRIVSWPVFMYKVLNELTWLHRTAEDKQIISLNCPGNLKAVFLSETFERKELKEIT
jgi:hypothetical protein